ncbi:ABC transporter substrate-binding protein/permease [Paludisphaera mucosa]|uniref:ABC transporter substrate-binding protein/permease n=1 Tax=Paludisphaera mucosa TaxID=3030827 RepID=A0ABT6F6W8_9BACT|nr:ABC transporter substrate-binding protein/permease [Paludisphaera mucosa]MDG3003337.1 ABC transporter substrate-binding protein/permease [Paludisphaera mucosa]
MEEEPDASESDAVMVRPSSRRLARPPLATPRPFLAAVLAILLPPLLATPARGDALDEVRARKVLRYGSDMEGGGPYAYPDPAAPRSVTGFEVELMQLLARDLGATAEFSQGQWDKLLSVLDAGRFDVVVNGYEWTDARAEEYLATRPYYIYQLQLMGPKGGSIRSWAELERPRPDGRRWRVGVLTASAADDYAQEHAGASIEVVRFDGATDAMLAVQNGQYDFTLQDGPAASFYIDGFPGLATVGPPVARGYYVIYARKTDVALRDALDAGIGRLAASGGLRRVYEKYRIWNDLQGELTSFQGPIAAAAGPRDARGWAAVARFRGRLFDAARVTIGLSFGSMPLAMAVGLMVALGRMYGPGWLRGVLAGYVELIRGTPLMLQLYVLFFLFKLPPWVAGIAGLALNYSAYEAEIYRAGLQAVPRGQMEAALALGMSKWMALRRVVIPQAVRIVIPPVSNDFIALFKDTSVCSVITLVELTKEYSILANSTRAVLEFAAATAAIYLAMSLPLSWFSRWSERRLGAEGVKGALA